MRAKGRERAASYQAGVVKELRLLAAGVLQDVMRQPAAAEAVDSWAPGSAVMAVRITS